jgi:hypothetical protein
MTLRISAILIIIGAWVAGSEALAQLQPSPESLSGVYSGKAYSP